jgi:hypothetical protein
MRSNYTMNKVTKLIVIIMSIIATSMIFSGCGNITAEDLTGEYVLVDHGKETKEDGKKYYLMIKEKDTFFENKPAIEIRFTKQRYNQELDKYYYMNSDFYVDAKTLKEFDRQSRQFTLNEDKTIVIDDIQYKKISNDNVNLNDTNYTDNYIYRDLNNLPKYRNATDDTIRDIVYY